MRQRREAAIDPGIGKTTTRNGTTHRLGSPGSVLSRFTRTLVPADLAWSLSGVTKRYALGRMPRTVSAILALIARRAQVRQTHP